MGDFAESTQICQGHHLDRSRCTFERFELPGDTVGSDPPRRFEMTSSENLTTSQKQQVIDVLRCWAIPFLLFVR
jgi:hypothetical protein